MADEAGKSWQRLVKDIAPRLPGAWSVGRPGPRAILARRTDEWLLTWVGLDRVRATAAPWLVAGVVGLMEPFALTYHRGLRSDRVRRPGGVHLLAPDAAMVVERFIVDDALPLIDGWSADRLATEAEAQWNLPPTERGSHMQHASAAGWRVVNDTGSPVEVATQAATEWRAKYAPDWADWYDALAATWEAGGRPAALSYLVEQRDAALSGLKLR